MLIAALKASVLTSAVLLTELLLLDLTNAASVVVGKAPGFAAGTTGGGDVEPVYPTTIKELGTFLSDDKPRIVVLKQEFDFIDMRAQQRRRDVARKNNLDCLAKKNGFKGQDFIEPDASKCDGEVVDVTYDNAGRRGLKVGSNKTIVGEGTSGVLNGKGIDINVILQNIHITNLNPHVVWGGDGLSISGDDSAVPTGIWIDHVKISNVGRQMFVTHFSGSKDVTISNTDFDGNTKFSSSCDGHHYWGLMILGTKTQLSLLGNSIHHTSGRSPKIGGKTEETVVHAANNYFYENTGHAFSVTTKGYVLVEGNYFASVKTPNEGDPDGNVLVPKAVGDCKASIGRDCELNVLMDSGDLTGNSEDAVTSVIGTYKTQIGGYPVTGALKLSGASGNFGVGELGNDVAQTDDTDGVATTNMSGSTGRKKPLAPSATEVAKETSALQPNSASDAPTTQGSMNGDTPSTSALITTTKSPRRQVCQKIAQ